MRLDEKLNEDELKMIDNLGKFKMIKFLNVMRGVYNLLCPDCREKVFKNPRLKITEYCTTCNQMATNKIKCFLGRI